MKKVMSELKNHVQCNQIRSKKWVSKRRYKYPGCYSKTLGKEQYCPLHMKNINKLTLYEKKLLPEYKAGHEQKV